MPEDRASPTSCPFCRSPRVRAYGNRWDLPLWECRGCRSGFLWPRPSPEELDRRYREEHQTGKWAEILSEHDAQIFLDRASFLLGKVGPRRRLLDVGCGDGVFLHAWRSVGGRGVGLEVTPEIAVVAATGEDPVVAGYLDAVRPGADFDLVTFWDVLEHVRDPVALLTQGVQRLRPGGLAAASMPNFRSLTSILHGGGWQYLNLDRFGHLSHLSPRGLAAVFRNAGLEVVAVRTTGSVDLRHVPEVRGFGAPGPSVVWTLDRVSGLLARLAPTLRYGNTLEVVGRRPA